MAQVVLVRPPQVAQQQQATPQLQEQVTTQLQSIQLVQSLLGASIGSLAWIRGLFPDECFETIRYLPEYARSYQAFSTAEPTQRRDAGAIRVTRLQKGASPQADRLLEYLENGVFHALENGYLKALQLGIYTDEKTPEAVMEAYTFTFSYRDSETRFAVQVKTGNQERKELALEGSTPTAMVQQVTRNLVSTTQALHPLPDKRWLSIRLTYTDDTPAHYNPPGFRRLALGTPGFAIPGDVVRSNCGVLDTGLHLVSVKVSNLDIDPDEPVGVGVGRVGRRLTTRFFEVNEDIDKYLDWEAPLEEDDLDLDLDQTAENSPAPEIVENTPPIFPINRVPEARPDKASTPEFVTATQPDEMVPDSFKSPGQEEPSQENGAVHVMAPPDPFRIPEQVAPSQEKNLIREMLRPPKPALGEVATQVLAGQKRSATEDPNTSTHSTKILRSVDVRIKGQKLVLTKAKAEEMGKRKKSKRSKTKTRSGGKRRKKPSITCECGYKAEDIGGEMICCDNCDGWQHVACYGFREKDTRIPDTHYCYTCLFVPGGDAAVLEELKKLAFFRRALLYVWQVDKLPTTIEVFAAELRCNRDNALLVLLRLVEEGFVISKAKHQTKGSVQNLQHYRVQKTAETENLMLTEYFYPNKLIEHLYPPPSTQIEQFSDNDATQSSVNDAGELPINDEYTLPVNPTQSQDQGVLHNAEAIHASPPEVVEHGNVAQQINSMYVGI